MSAITPKAAGHANLPALASRFVSVAALPSERTWGALRASHGV